MQRQDGRRDRGQRRAAPVIVLVEDEPGLRSAWLLLLRDCGYITLEAPDGKLGLALIRSVKPDAVITDLVMPISDGFSLAQAMRADEALRSVPIIAATGTTVSHDDEELFDIVLSKPFEPSILLHNLAAILVETGQTDRSVDVLLHS
ncbi:MAG: response regulator [Longimicrobiales bacterium]